MNSGHSENASIHQDAISNPHSPPSPSPSPSSSPSLSANDDSSSDDLRPNHSWGPAFFERRRYAWVSGNLSTEFDFHDGARPRLGRDAPEDERPSAALEKLAHVLSIPDIENDEEIWEGYLKSIHTKLVGGNKVKRGMSLPFAIRILHAGWLRDGTWSGDDNIPGQRTTTSFFPPPPPLPSKSSPSARFRSPSYRAATPAAIVPPWMKRVSASNDVNSRDVRSPQIPTSLRHPDGESSEQIVEMAALSEHAASHEETASEEEENSNRRTPVLPMNN